MSNQKANPTAKRHYHLAGIAGVGMSALAQALAAEGYDVSGSDRDLDRGADLDVLRKLRLAGVRLRAQDGSGVTAGTAALVISTAIEKDNPDILAAEGLSAPVLHRADCLARLMEGKPSVAVTGTSGKSTVTGMIGWMLEQVGADPVVVNGAPALNWVTDRAIGNARVASTRGARPARWWVFEADESDRSLLKFSPNWAVITNISKDHFGVEETKALFAEFRGRVKKGVVDEAAVGEALAQTRAEISEAGSVFVFKGVEARLALPGRHNVANAVFALALCERLGFKVADLVGALGTFRGIRRRLEVVGQAGGVTVVDDYAHNPAKIRAAWESLAPYHRRILAVWRPHGHGPLRSMMEELVGALGEICRPRDQLLVLPVYDAGGTADRSVNSDQLIDRLAGKGAPAALAAEGADLAKSLAARAEPGDVILIIGARDPGLSALAKRVAELLMRR
ncbi:MAG: Mur ligase family protein [Verrucomicrobiota bacterium]|nr:Mur ligase family protein [Verrucomicrobiota bacterium]